MSEFITKFIHFIVELMPIALWVLIFCAISFAFVWFNKTAKDSARHWSALPGIFMGVGIFFTFLTIYDTFNHIPFIEDKPNEINTNKLIEMIGSGFLGSIVGLFCSIVITLLIKTQINCIEAKEQEAAGENNNPYLLLQQIVENTSLNKSELVKLNTAFDTFNTKTETLNSDMIENFSKKFEALMKKVESEAIAKSLGNLEKINADLSNNLEKIFGTTGTTIAEGQTNLKNSIDALKSALEGKIDAINQAATNSAELAKGSVTMTLEEIKTQVANMGASIASEADTVITQKVESINNTFSTIDEKQQNAIQIQGEIVENMQSVFNEMQAAFNTKIGEINKAADEIQGGIIDMGNNITEKAADIVSAKIQSLEETFKRIEQYQRRSETMLKDVTSSFKETVEKYEQVNEDKTELIRIIGQQLKELQKVRENGTTLIENWNGIAKTMESMQDRINQINNVITQLDNIKTVLLNQQN